MCYKRSDPRLAVAAESTERLEFLGRCVGDTSNDVGVEENTSPRTQ